MAIMAAFEAFMAEEAAATAAAEAAGSTLGAEALATTLGTEALAGLGAEALGGASTVAPGITQATMAADAAAGGAGAGSAGINAAQVQAQQAAAQQIANAGIAPEAVAPTASSTANYFTQGVPQLPSSPLSQYNLSAPPAGGEGFRLGANAGAEGLRAVPSTANALYSGYQPSALEVGMDKAIKFAEKNPFTAMTAAYMGANALGLLQPTGATFNNAPYTGPLSKYKLSPNFKASSANPADFQYRGYAAGGGIMGAMPEPTNNIQVGYDEGGDVPGYASGGSLSDSIASYQKMLAGHPVEAPAASRDVGIYYDQDPDTRYQDALTAAQIRQAKVNQRAYVSPPVAKRPTPMGQLQMASVKPKKQSGGGDDVEAAQGGIMHSSLGGYAAGGNPRLLKGPGDGMSDNIPATINGRQPARLADGEFVVPADVVSHLGNGSTDAGAKQLHAMMDKVRKARTGNPKQGKEINPKKYMPK